jgi:hypothetical protein
LARRASGFSRAIEIAIFVDHEWPPKLLAVTTPFEIVKIRGDPSLAGLFRRLQGKDGSKLLRTARDCCGIQHCVPTNRYARPKIAKDMRRLSDKRQELLQEMARTYGNFHHPEEFTGSLATATEAYLAAGQKDEALAGLQKCYEKREAYIIYLKVNPFLSSLREDPAFQELERKVGLLSF